MAYKAGSAVVGKILRKLDRMADKWEKKTLEGAKDWEKWYGVFEDTVEAFVSGKAGETLDREGMEALINSIKEAKVRYAQEQGR